MVGMNVFGAGIEHLTHSLFGKGEPVLLVLCIRNTNCKHKNTPNSKHLCSWLYPVDSGDGCDGVHVGFTLLLAFRNALMNYGLKSLGVICVAPRKAVGTNPFWQAIKCTKAMNILNNCFSSHTNKYQAQLKTVILFAFGFITRIPFFRRDPKKQKWA